MKHVICFFFQAEDGIRDYKVTGVQTCALPILLFKGTERFKKGEIDLITLKNGGGNNAFTSHDFTAYYFNFAADRWDVALEIESDRMVNCAFDPEEFEAEKKVVIEELKTGLDSPWGLLLQEQEAAAFKVHPYRNPIVG